MEIARPVLKDLRFLVDFIQQQDRGQGAIERVLYGFALSLLVDERHYAAS